MPGIEDVLCTESVIGLKRNWLERNLFCRIKSAFQYLSHQLPVGRDIFGYRFPGKDAQLDCVRILCCGRERIEI